MDKHCVNKNKLSFLLDLLEWLKKIYLSHKTSTEQFYIALVKLKNLTSCIKNIKESVALILNGLISALC